MKNIYFLFAILLITNVSPATGQIINTIAGCDSPGYTGDGGPAIYATFGYTRGVAVDGIGNIYVVDNSNNAVRKINAAGIISTIISGSTPTGIAVDKAGNVYVSFHGITGGVSNVVLKWNGDSLTTVAGNGYEGYSGDGGAATSAELYYPTSLAVDDSGNLYIADYLNNAIRKVVAATGYIYTIAGGGPTASGYSGDGGLATSAKLWAPIGVAVDDSGNVYVADNANSAIRKIVTATGYIYSIVGHPSPDGYGNGGFYGDGGLADTALIEYPYAVAVDHSGNIYIADFTNRVRKIDTAGIITTYAGNSQDSGYAYYSYGYTGVGGPPDSAGLAGPNGLALDALGNLLIDDAGNYVIRKIVPANGIYFPRGTTQSASVCENAVDSINSLLTVTDTVSGETNTWSIVEQPTHGVINGSYTATSTGGTLTPSGLTYTPTLYYTGKDSFVVQVTNGGVVVYTMVMITVTPSPVLSTSALYLTICNGATTSITETGTGTPGGGDTILNQDFNTSLAPWTIDTTGSVYLPAVAEWTDEPNDYAGINGTYYNPDSTSFAVSEGVHDTSGEVVKSRLVSPYFSTVGYTDATLYFDQSYKSIGDSSAEVDISTDSGITWTTLVNYALTYPNYATGILPFYPESISLTDYIGYPHVQVRFYYYTRFGRYWAIDNIVLIGYPTGINEAVWSPVTNLFTDAGDTTAYTAGSYRNTVFVHPTTVTTTTNLTYYATQSIGSCAFTDSITITVIPTPQITGNDSICVGGYDTLSDAIPYGAWVSRNADAYVLLYGDGTVSAVSPGVDTISYTTTESCAVTVTKTITIIALPVVAAVSGGDSVCVGASVTLGDTSAGGVWRVFNAAAGITTAGIVNGLSAGYDTVEYTLTNMCGSSAVSKPITVTTVADAGTITGDTVACSGTEFLLSDTVTGGIWSSGGAAIATIDSTGAVTGLSAGSALISYTVINNCGVTAATKNIIIDTLPGTISGAAEVCTGAGITLGDATAGGVWSSSNIAATVTDGIVTGVTAGTDTISYAITNACGAKTVTATVVIDPLPVAAAIIGADSVCIGSVIALADDSAGGVWNSSNSMATVASGFVTGMIAGTDTISYAVTSICGTTVVTKLVKIDPLATAGIIIGIDTVCEGAAITLADTISGGIWSSRNTAATVAGGVVSGVTAGADTILYTVFNSCDTAVAIFPVRVISHTVCSEGVSAITTLTGLQVYPNPNSGTFMAEVLSAQDETAHIVISNVAGVQIQAFTVTTNRAFDISLDNASGLYLLSAITPQGKYEAKVVIGK